MLKKIYKNKSLLTVILVAFLIVLGMLGTDWEVGFAEQTLPIVYSISPQTICAGSPDTQVTIIGDDFISVDYTWIRWLDITGDYSFIVPDEVSKTELRFTVLSDKLDQVFPARLWVVNHPPALDEIVGYYTIEIVGCNFIYLPLIMN
jgi:hypothetical protein